MITAFCTSLLLRAEYGGGRRVVTRAKYAISALSRHGKVPFRPMPLLRVAATMSVRLSNDGGGGIAASGDGSIDERDIWNVLILMRKLELEPEQSCEHFTSRTHFREHEIQ
jgi:hypothetical protein